MPEPATSSIVRERVWIEGQRRLAGELAYDESAAPLAAVMLVNPHPYMGGGMHNNVIARLHEAIARAGAVSLRFDYGGVGDSEGPIIDVAASMAEFWATNHAPIDPLMIADTADALRWFHGRVPAPLALVGYSFGSHAAVRTIAPCVRAMALVSPTIGHHAFEAGFARSRPTLVITSDNDFATPVERFDHWLRGPARRDVTEHVRIAGAEHFFLDQEPALCECVMRFLRSALNPNTGAVRCA